MVAGLTGGSASPMCLVTHGVRIKKGGAEMLYKRSQKSFLSHPRLLTPILQSAFILFSFGFVQQAREPPGVHNTYPGLAKASFYRNHPDHKPINK